MFTPWNGTPSSSLDPTEILAAARGALSIVNRTGEPPLEASDLLVLLRFPDKTAASCGRIRRLLSTDEAPILQDLVMGGLCSFSDLSVAMVAYGVASTPVTAWIGGLAAAEVVD